MVNKDYKELEYSKELEKILNTYCGGNSSWKTDPLNQAEITMLLTMLEHRLQYMNQLITREEYIKKESVR